MLDAGDLPELGDADGAVAACPSCGRQLIFRSGSAGAGDPVAALVAFLDGLAELEQATGIPAYGIWASAVPARFDWFRACPGGREQLWRAASRELITEGPAGTVSGALTARLCPDAS